MREEKFLKKEHILILSFLIVFSLYLIILALSRFFAKELMIYSNIYHMVDYLFYLGLFIHMSIPYLWTFLLITAIIYIVKYRSTNIHVFRGKNALNRKNNSIFKIYIILLIILNLQLSIPYLHYNMPIGPDAPRYMHRLQLIEKYPELLLLGGNLAPMEWRYLSAFLTFLPVLPLRLLGIEYEKIWILERFVVSYFYIFSQLFFVKSLTNDEYLAVLTTFITIFSIKFYNLNDTLYRNVVALSLIYLIIGLFYKYSLRKDRKNLLKIFIMLVYLAFQYIYLLIIPISIILYYIILTKRLNIKREKRTFLLLITFFSIVSLCFLFFYKYIISLLFDIIFMQKNRITTYIRIENLSLDLWYNIFVNKWNYSLLENPLILLLSYIGLYIIFRNKKDYSFIFLIWYMIVSFIYSFLLSPNIGSRLKENFPSELPCAIALNYLYESKYFKLLFIDKNLSLIRYKISLFFKIKKYKIKFSEILFIIIVVILSTLTIYRMPIRVLSKPFAPPIKIINDAKGLSRYIMESDLRDYNIIFLASPKFSKGTYYDHLAWIMYYLKVRVNRIDVYIGNIGDLVKGERGLPITDFPKVWNQSIKNPPKYIINNNTLIITICSNIYCFYNISDLNDLDFSLQYLKEYDAYILKLNKNSTDN